MTRGFYVLMLRVVKVLVLVHEWAMVVTMTQMVAARVRGRRR